MTKTVLSVIFMAAIMLTAGIAASVDMTGNASAAKAKGIETTKYGSKTNVCGLQLCSEYPGGKEAWEEEQKGIKSIEEPEPEMEESMTQEKTMKQEKTMTSEKTMTKTKAHSYKAKMGTLTSKQDPGVGHEQHQLAIILPPSEMMYKGVLSYSASEPIQLVALHGPLGPGEDNGQPTWSPKGSDAKFALTFVDPKTNAGTWMFTGNALAVHTMKTKPFTVSYSVSYMEKGSSETVKTETMESMIDPGQGHSEHSLAIILPPSEKTYSGLLTYSASEPIQLVALHGPLGPGEDKGQPIWTPDGETKFALTFIDPKTNMGTWKFAGNAIAVHTLNTDGFNVSYSVAAGQN